MVPLSADDNSLLNNILRVHFAASNYRAIQLRSNGPWEIDHFFEVQHVVDIIKRELHLNWYEMEIGYFLDLSSCINNRRNLFRIPRAWNQEKKKYPLAEYPTNYEIETYLITRLDGEEGTVEDSVRELVEDMKHRNTPFSHLTQAVGKALSRAMGWD